MAAPRPQVKESPDARQSLPDLVFEGHALVSADGMIADADSHMPPSLRVDADWAQFQAALERSVIVASGARATRPTPTRPRRRLVLTRAGRGA